MYKHVARLKTLDKRTDTIISETGNASRRSMKGHTQQEQEIVRSLSILT